MADPRQDTPNIDHLRERLRALGYLNAPVDRYVLGSIGGRTGLARFATGAGLRIGIVAGLLLGISSAAALAARAPGFIATRRDAIVLAIALAILFTLVTAVAVGSTVIAASWFARRSTALTARRARIIAASAGIVVALACASYLTLWWNAAQDLFRGLTTSWNLGAMALAAAVALLLAHAVSVVILAALVRSTSTADIAAGGLLSSRGFLIAFGVVLFAGSAVLLATDAGRNDPIADAPPIVVQPAGYAVRVIAIDGFDEQVSDRLSREGSLPALTRLLEGTRARVPAAGAAPDPARDWTTIATGQPAERHGITSLESRRAVGIEGRLPSTRSATVQLLLSAADLLRLTTPSIATGAQRQVPAFWEVAAAAGLRTAVINWWATWPAPAGDDVVITDRALLRLDTGGVLDAEIAPPQLYDALREQWPKLRERAAQEALASFAKINDVELRRVMIRSAELDLLVAYLGTSFTDRPLDLLVVYLPGLDIAQHSLLQASTAQSVAALSARVAAIEEYYRFLDKVVRRLLPASSQQIDAAVLWPGRLGNGQGALVMRGGPVRSDTVLPAEVNVAGMMLYLLGLPLAEDLGMQSVTAAVSDEFARRHPVRRIANYSAVRPIRSAGGGQPLDAEALERLRSLGYIR